MIAIDDHAEGVTLWVKAHAGARKNGIVGEHDGAIKVAVTQAPERGKANKAIIEVLARQFQLRKNQIEILRGDTSPQKQLLIRDISQPELSERIAAVLASL